MRTSASPEEWFTKLQTNRVSPRPLPVVDTRRPFLGGLAWTETKRSGCAIGHLALPSRGRNRNGYRIISANQQFVATSLNAPAANGREVARRPARTDRDDQSGAELSASRNRMAIITLHVVEAFDRCTRAIGGRGSSARMGTVGAVRGNRTLILCLVSCRSAIELTTAL